MNSVKRHASAEVACVHAIDSIDASDSARFGGKATGLARMAAAGIPVPPAFVIDTDGYREFRAGGSLPEAIAADTRAALLRIESATGKRFGSRDSVPLLVSVRSGAQVSMPGMMDTVLNLGITAGGALAMTRESGNAEFALDTWMRFWRMFSDIVLSIDGESIAASLAAQLAAAKANPTAESFAALEASVVARISEQGIDDVQTDPYWQLLRAIAAVFESWDSRRARAYRAHHKIAGDMGTAVTIQAMVFGNFDAQSGSGVVFTRDPNTGDRDLYGEYMLGRQGEDLVSGSATPKQLTEPGAMSEQHLRELYQHGQTLERIYGDAVDIEFTIEGSQLYFLQVRAAKRTAYAAVRIAADLVEDGIATRQAALQKVSVEQLKRLLRPAFEPAALAAASVLATGIGASPGHSYGIAVLDADRAATLAATGERVILLRPTTSPQDIRGMLASRGIVTARGGALSHAAVVSRALDVPCVVGCEELEIEPEQRRFSVRGQVFEEGAALSVDGATGRVYAGSLPLEAASQAADHIERLLGLADGFSKIRVWVAGINGGEVRAAIRQSASGLGVIALTDLMLAAGTLNEMIEAVNDLSRQGDNKAAKARLSRLAFDACRQLMLESPGLPIDVRLPNLGSPRAQRLIGDWAALAPRLLLPLGLKSFYGSLLQGIAEAARKTGHTQVTPLIAGIHSAEELQVFQKEAAALGLPRAGAVLQNPAGLAAAAQLAACSPVIWIDARELIRNFYGYPSALSFADEVFEGYVTDGCLSHNPRAALGPALTATLRGVVEVAAAVPALRLGVECGDGTASSLVEDLYRTGLRTFSVPPDASAAVRLVLGQLASKSTPHA